MDSRFDYLYFFGNNKKVLIHAGIRQLAISVAQYWQDKGVKVEYSSTIDPKEDAIILFRSRFRPPLHLEFQSIDEYVLVPGIKNPRWIIRYRKEVIEHHGPIIKPSSFKAKIVWKLAKFLNKFNFFTLVFPDRIAVKRNSLEKTLFIGDFHNVSIIYTGAPGKFQKFSMKLLDKTHNRTSYLKLGTKCHAIQRIKNEISALKELRKIDFNHIETPKILDLIEHDSFYGLIQNDILGNDALTISYTTMDTVALEELFLKSHIQRTTIEKYFSKYKDLENSIDTSLDNLLERKKSFEIILSMSHGDYIPWNRFVSNDRVKIIDWELFGYRPLFYDILYFLLHKAYLIEKKSLQLLFEETMTAMDAVGFSKNHMEHEKILYLLISMVEIYHHYSANEEKGDEKFLKYINDYLSFLSTRYQSAERISCESCK